MARPEDTIHLWKLAAEENDCFHQPYPFANDHARFLFYRGPLSSLHYTPEEQYRRTVPLMAGLPGSGKDTWLAEIRPGLPVVSLDDIRSALGVDPTDDQGGVIRAARARPGAPAGATRLRVQRDEHNAPDARALDRPVRRLRGAG